MVGVIPAFILFLTYLGVNPVPLIVLTLIVGIVYILSQSRSGAMGIGQKKRMQPKESVPNISFDKIGGQQRSKDELKEALDFLIHRKKLISTGFVPLKEFCYQGLREPVKH